MAKTTTVHIADDLDGSIDASEITFSFNGTDYTIDLSKKNLTAFEKALKPYIYAATVSATKGSARITSARRGKTSRSKGGRTDLAQIREWARGQGIEVSERGRITTAVINQYEAAH